MGGKHQILGSQPAVGSGKGIGSSRTDHDECRRAVEHVELGIDASREVGDERCGQVKIGICVRQLGPSGFRQLGQTLEAPGILHDDKRQ